MALKVMSNRLGIAPTVNINDVYMMIPKDSVAFLPANSSWAFQMRYYLNQDVRNTEKVLEYFRSLSEKPEGWTDTRWETIKQRRNIMVAPVLTIQTTTAESLDISDPTDIDNALVKIYDWVKVNSEPSGQDITADSTLDDLVGAYLISQGL